MDNLTLLEFIKNLDYEGVEEAFTLRWNCFPYTNDNLDYLKNSKLVVYDSEADMIEKLSSSFANDYFQNSPFLKEHKPSYDIICCETPQGEKVVEYPCVLPHPDLDMVGFVIPYYKKLYSVYLDGLDYIDSASIKNFIWNLCINKTIFKLQSKVRYKLSITINSATHIKAIMVEDSFGSLNSIKDLNLYIRRYYGNTSALSEGFINREIIIDSSINNLSNDIIPKNIEIDVLLSNKRREITSKLNHSLSLNSDKSISIVPIQNSLIEILEAQIELLRWEIEKGEEGNKKFLIAPKELYEILQFFAQNEINTSYGHITTVLDAEKTYNIAKENNDCYENAKEEYLDEFYSDEASYLFDPDLDSAFINWFDWSYVVERKNSYILAYIE